MIFFIVMVFFFIIFVYCYVKSLWIYENIFLLKKVVYLNLIKWKFSELIMNKNEMWR